jgi:hypothetical protein
MSDVTRILSAIEQGDARAAEQLLPLVYDELRQLGYLWYFDFDGDGDVDGRDNGQFNRRFGNS